MKKTLFAFSATVALMVVPQISSASTVLARLKAEVPVAFRTHDTALPQGNYKVIVRSQNGSGPIASFTNLTTNRSVMAAVFRSQVDARAAPMIQLRCVDGECDVASITYRDTKWTFAPRKLTPEQTKRLYTMAVPLEVTLPAD